MKRYSCPFVCCKSIWLSGNTAPLILHHGQLHAPAAILPRHKPLVLTKSRTGWALESVLKLLIVDKTFKPVKNLTAMKSC